MCIRVTLYMTRMTRNVHPRLALATGWRRLIGSPKLQIIFHKRATKYRSRMTRNVHPRLALAIAVCLYVSIYASRSFYRVAKTHSMA